jgi:putative ubiquitin-RnfH superfamily antitoxin RatB of RatAB toxin-antitoxin module
MAERVITVEVVYAGADCQHLRRVDVVEGCTAIEAIEASGIADAAPAEAIHPDWLGIFSKRVPANHVVEQGDRIEIYRPLVLDPMQARRKRAR